jgi:hypothetical protein
MRGKQNTWDNNIKTHSEELSFGAHRIEVTQMMSREEYLLYNNDIYWVQLYQGLS